MKTLIWAQKAPGVWSATVGNAEAYTPLSVVGAESSLDAIKEMGDEPFPFKPELVMTEQIGRRTIACFPLDKTRKSLVLGFSS